MKKTIFITGASSGFGRETAKLFQKEGWNVIATIRSPEKGQELNELANMLVTQLDVENQATITQAIEEGLRNFGHIEREKLPRNISICRWSIRRNRYCGAPINPSVRSPMRWVSITRRSLPGCSKTKQAMPPAIIDS